MSNPDLMFLYVIFDQIVEGDQSQEAIKRQWKHTIGFYIVIYVKATCNVFDKQKNIYSREALLYYILTEKSHSRE